MTSKNTTLNASKSLEQSILQAKINSAKVFKADQKQYDDGQEELHNAASRKKLTLRE